VLGHVIYLTNLCWRRVSRTSQTLILRKRVAMIRVGTKHVHQAIRRNSPELEHDTARCSLLIRIDEVPCPNHQTSIVLASDQDVGSVLRNSLLAELVKNGKGGVTRLLDSSEGDQAKASIEGFGLSEGNFR